MTLHHLLQAIQECDNGQFAFNTGEIRAFLFGKKWYPLRATINRAREIANETSDLTTDRALVELVYLNKWTRVSDVLFQNQTPLSIDTNEELKEAKQLSATLNSLMN